MNEEEIREQLRLFIHRRLSDADMEEVKIKIQNNTAWGKWYEEEHLWVNKYMTYEGNKNKVMISGFRKQYPISLQELPSSYRYKNYLIIVGILLLGIGGSYLLFNKFQRSEVTQKEPKFTYLPVYDISSSSGFIETKHLVATDSLRTEWLDSTDSSYWFSGSKLQIKLEKHPDWQHWTVYKDNTRYYLETTRNTYLLKADPTRFFRFQPVNQK
ncbi:hypothetical protein [Siphonobacter sp. SORGH_AS_1065]|uniref:hypothetical protein n=1 Tax=Siphonobacter sp. SORGH_AS_1065 TaxID=3041795 RepID=UPI00278930AE|nr:hypothetical protein [Siphonobacter sp. SORGH_AS_1065]MDQ1089777.1 hypothetical protein [Siphonobacter sp. SORGH_AS_1065]